LKSRFSSGLQDHGASKPEASQLVDGTATTAPMPWIWFLSCKVLSAPPRVEAAGEHTFVFAPS
jgi:hypothetical protein